MAIGITKMYVNVKKSNESNSFSNFYFTFTAFTGPAKPSNLLLYKLNNSFSKMTHCNKHRQLFTL